MRYRVKLVGDDGKAHWTNWGFTNKKEAIEYAKKWEDLGKECQIIDTKKGERIR